MLTQRLLVLFILIPAVVGVIYLGGWVLVGFTLITMLMGAWEYWNMFRSNGFSPSLILLLLGVLMMILSRKFYQFEALDEVILIILLVSSAVYIIRYEGGDEKAAINCALTIAGTIYLGGTSAYILSLRTLPDGMWLQFGGSAEEPWCDVVAIEACSSFQNLLDKRSRFAPSTHSMLAICPLPWN